jgi:hypothetical protein
MNVKNMTDDELDSLKSQIKLEEIERKSQIVAVIEKESVVVEIKKELKEISEVLKKQHNYSMVVKCPVEYSIEADIICAEINKNYEYSKHIEKQEKEIVDSQVVRAQIKIMQKKWNNVVKKIEKLASKYSIEYSEIWKIVDIYGF